MTISEIARLAGVSSASVSRYLNHGSLSEEKKEKIRAVIRETNYKPSEYARALRTKKSRKIGVIVPQIDSESAPRMLRGIHEELEQKGYHVLFMNSERDMDKEIEMLEDFAGSQVDGLILAASVISEKHREYLRSMPFPVVLAGQRSEDFSCVYHDDYSAARKIMGYLLEQGCKYPAYLGVTRKDLAAGEGRYQGVYAALRENGISPEHLPQIQVDFTVEGGYSGMQYLLDRGTKVDGVCCASDLIAAGAMQCLKDRNLKIPSQIKVTGIGHGMLADLLTPRLTTVHYHYRTCGRAAAGILLDLIENPLAGRVEKKLECSLVIQESV